MKATRQSTKEPYQGGPIKASDLVKRLQEAIDLYGDHKITMEDCSKDGPYERNLDDFSVRCCVNRDQTERSLLIVL